MTAFIEMSLCLNTGWRRWILDRCYLMQLAMRNFDVKKNCLTTKDLSGAVYDGVNIPAAEILCFIK
jgi:hypothetical protein